MKMQRIQTLSKYIILAAMAAALIGGLSACNTLNGMGQDLEGAGRTMQDTF